MIVFPEVELSEVNVDYPILGRAGSSEALEEGADGWGAVAHQRGHGVVLRALENINLRVSAGDSVGLIGRNGAGKTTLLKVLAGLLPVSSGVVDITGSRSSLISMQAGFTNELSGRENIYLRAMIMGYSRREVDQEIGSIVEFTELGSFIEMPLYSYSAGMRFRLAFAIVTAFPADVVILDEWIATGDAHFKTKVENRLKGYLSQAGILFFASHSQALISSLCNKTITLERGRVVARTGD